MAPADVPTIPARVGRQDRLADTNGTSKTIPTSSDEAVASILNGAIRKPKKAVMTPKPASSSRGSLGTSIRRRVFGGRDEDAPLQDSQGEGDEQKEDEEEHDDAAGADVGEEEENFDAPQEKEASPKDLLLPDSRLRTNDIRLPKRDLRSGSRPIVPPQKSHVKIQPATKQIRNREPTTEPLGQNEGSDDDLARRWSAQARSATKNTSRRLALKSVPPPKESGKRKRSGEKPNPYDIPDDDLEEEVRKVGPLTKRTKVVGKPPINMLGPPRITRTTSGMTPESFVRQSVEVRVPIKSTESTPTQRGRPPKAQSVFRSALKSRAELDEDEDQSDNEQSLFIPETQAQRSKAEGNQNDKESSCVPKSGQQENEDDGDEAEEVSDMEVQDVQDGEEEEGDGVLNREMQADQDDEEQAAADEGITQILQNPSPIKPLQQQALHPSTHASKRVDDQTPRQPPSQVVGRASSREQTSIQARSRSASIATANLKSAFESRAEWTRGRRNDDSSEDENSNGANERNDGSDSERWAENVSLFRMRTLEKMYKTSKQVGKSWNSEDNQFVVRKARKKPHTEVGESLSTTLKRLVVSYEEGDFALPKTSTTIKKELSDLQDDIKKVLRVLNKPERDNESQATLEDLYFCILPELIQVVILAAKVYTLSRDIEQADLKEFLKLSRMVKDLARYSLRHSSAPKEDGTKAIYSRYRFSKPTKDIEPNIAALCASLEAELAFRHQDKKRRQRERRKALEAKARKEKEERDSRSKQARAEQIQLHQKESLRKSIIDDPLVCRLVLAELEKIDTRSGQRESTVRLYARPKITSCSPSIEDELNYDENLLAIDEQDEDNFEDDDPQLERVSVFGLNNNRQEQGPKPWTAGEQARFIEIMKDNDEPDKYEQTARELNCAIDDVFAKAKELQTVMDRAHEEGKFNTEADRWTWQIWNPRPESQV